MHVEFEAAVEAKGVDEVDTARTEAEEVMVWKWIIEEVVTSESSWEHCKVPQLGAILFNASMLSKELDKNIYPVVYDHD